MQVNIKEGVRTVKATQAELRALERAVSVLSDCEASGIHGSVDARTYVEGVLDYLKEESSGQTKEATTNDPN